VARTFIGLGSNVGDRRQYLEEALTALADLGTITCGSPIYETEPIGVTNQDPFENAVVGLETDLAPTDLLTRLLDIERRHGRVRGERWDPRTLDLDILWYDGRTIDVPGLTIPHPRIRERNFVLAPLVYVSPSLGDAHGPYAESLASVGHQDIRKVTGPVDATTPRWMAGLRDALNLQGGNGSYSAAMDLDWENASGSMFGGYLAASVLSAAGAEHPDKVPTSLTYRYLEAVPGDVVVTIEVEHNRRSARSAEMSMSILVDDAEFGRAHMSVAVDRGDEIASPPMPKVMPISDCSPLDEIIDSMGGEPGNSIRSWRPVENWKIPDLVDGSTGMLRAWCPNTAEGWDDAYLSAASLFMPIDALIWPVTMLGSGLLGVKPMFTPTVEITARFAKSSNLGGWFLGEARIDHLTTKSVVGTIQVWDEDGSHAATGHSLNLTLG